MRVIFSRKGFDGSYGGCPSPLIEGRPISLPIPVTRRSRTAYGDLPEPVPALVADLTRGRLTADHLCHLDPDLTAGSLPSRAPGWRDSLGQVAQSQGHLEKQGVGPGDLFIFWGLFRPVEQRDGRWRYVGRPLHAAFGWLQVEHVARHPGGGPLSTHPWLADHPHTQEGWKLDNTIYVAAETLSGFGIEAPGYGKGTESTWQLVPPWLHLASEGTGMTYHPAPRWLAEGGLRSAARGQEFVADIGGRADARVWVADLIAGHQ